MSNGRPQQELPPFEELVAMAEQDPKGFNHFKRSMCDALIDATSQHMQRRLRAQQSHIDLVVGRCKTPTQANVTLMNELSAQMAKFRHALDGEEDTQPPVCADIIPFRKIRI